jgi:ferredoxin
MEDSVAKVIGDEVAIGDADDCREAAESCPVEAITLEE